MMPRVCSISRVRSSSVSSRSRISSHPASPALISPAVLHPGPGFCCTPVIPPLLLVPAVSWAPVPGTGAWAPSPALFFGMLQGRGSGGAGGGHCCAWPVLGALGSHRAPGCSLFPALLWPILSLNHFLPPIPFSLQCFCCCLLSQQLFYSTGYFDYSVNYLSRWSSSAVMLLACFFPYTNSASERRRQIPTISEKCPGRLLWPPSASPGPSPSPAPFRPNLGLLSSLSLLHMGPRPGPAAARNRLPLFS